MTERYNSVTVVFDEAIREDDLEQWMNAIRMMKRVIAVVPGERSSAEVGKFQAMKQIRESFWEFYQSIDPWRRG